MIDIKKMSNIKLSQKSSPNFCDEEGNAYLVRCPECKRENYIPMVATGVCAWCGYNLNEHKVLENEDK